MLRSPVHFHGLRASAGHDHSVVHSVLNQTWGHGKIRGWILGSRIFLVWQELLLAGQRRPQEV